MTRFMGRFQYPMKNTISNILLVLFIPFGFFTLKAQEDVNWIFGYQSKIPNDSFMGLKMTFMQDTYAFEKFTIPFSQGPSAVISNSEGELIAYSNNCDIANGAHEIMPNGDGLNPGHVHDNYCEGNLGTYPNSESGLLLSTNDEQLHMVHIGLSRNFIADKVYQTTIQLENEEYVVTKKNEILLDYEGLNNVGPFTSRVDACRHGNGRDWWVIVPHAHQGHYVSLFTENGIDSFIHQKTGIYTEEVWDVGQSVFSPDGSIYGRCNIKTQVQLMDFDRCSGRLSDARMLTLEIPKDEVYAIGMAFSPNGRFLYVSASTKLYQFDLYADDVDASQVLVGEFDGFHAPFAVTFYQLQLAPNGKIYMSCTNGCTYLHVIHNPNEKGLQCNFEQRGLRLPVNNAYEVPNIPNFRLGALPGSACDSLTSSRDITTMKEIEVSPNPTTGYFSVKVPEHLSVQDINLRLYSLDGKSCGMKINEVSQNEIQIDISNLVDGVYVLKMKDRTTTYYSRIIKQY